MTYKVGSKGQVVIPKELRDGLGLKPGDEVVFWLDGDHVVLRPAQSHRALKGRFAGSDLVHVLKEERRADQEEGGR